MKYEYRREERNDAVGKGHIVVATDANGIENVVAFCGTENEAIDLLRSLLNGDTTDAAKIVNEGTAVPTDAEKLP